MPKDQYMMKKKYDRQALWLSVIGILCMTLRFVGLGSKSLSYDELQSVTHAMLPIKDLIKSVGIFDPHPPLYYIQLHYWLILGTADWLIKMNSVMWAALALFMVFLLGKDLFDTKTALISTLIFAVMPLAVFYAQEVRMYSFLIFLSTGSFFFFQKYISKPSYISLIGTVSVTEIFLYSHGAGFVILISLFTYAFWYFRYHQYGDWHFFLQMGFLFLVIGVLYFPWLRLASAISVGHTLNLSVNHVAETLFNLLYGFHNMPMWLKYLIVICFLVYILSGVLNETNAQAIFKAFVVNPIAFCLIVSYFYQSILLDRTLVYTLPFWSILIAHAMVQADKRISFNQKWSLASVVVTTVFFLTYGTILQQNSFRHHWNIYAAVQFIQSNAQKGDITYVSSERLLWGIAWYLIGPGSVFPPNMQQPMVSDAGIKLVSRLDLAALGENIDCWLVYRSSDDVSPFSNIHLNPTVDFIDLKVTHIDR